jgi:uncharacterized protein (TIGR02646 family)
MPENEVLSKEDYDLITSAIKEGGKVWDNKLIAPIKNKVKSLLREVQNETCCYCKRNTTGEFKMVLDIEHILPKSHHPELMFNLVNLAIACKRCNMLIKKDDRSFIVNLGKIKISPFESSNYKLIHPNLDIYFDILRRVAIEINDTRLIKYTVVDGQDKGQYTYDYFKLVEFEQDSFNKAQGLNDAQIDTDKIDENTTIEIRKLLGI